MTHKRKRIYIVAMLCVALVIGIDRFVLGYTPEAAQGGMVTSSSSIDPIIHDKAVTRSIPEIPFPHFVPILVEKSFVDYFMPPSLRAHQATNGQNGQTSAANVRGQEKKQRADYLTFESSRTLDAVLLSTKFRVAIVSGHWVQVGQSIDGCKLRELTDNIARWECNDGSATLRVINIPSLLQD